jgi:hypothetical protein
MNTVTVYDVRMEGRQIKRVHVQLLSLVYKRKVQEKLHFKKNITHSQIASYSYYITKYFTFSFNC